MFRIFILKDLSIALIKKNKMPYFLSIGAELDFYWFDKNKAKSKTNMIEFFTLFLQFSRISNIENIYSCLIQSLVLILLNFVVTFEFCAQSTVIHFHIRPGLDFFRSISPSFAAGTSNFLCEFLSISSNIFCWNSLVYKFHWIEDFDM